jgi:hypothetical protein
VRTEVHGYYKLEVSRVGEWPLHPASGVALGAERAVLDQEGRRKLVSHRIDAGNVQGLVKGRNCMISILCTLLNPRFFGKILIDPKGGAYV